MQIYRVNAGGHWRNAPVEWVLNFLEFRRVLEYVPKSCLKTKVQIQAYTGMKRESQTSGQRHTDIKSNQSCCPTLRSLYVLLLE